MPGVKTPAERGIIGAWAYDARLAAELTVSEAVLKLGEMGHRVHEATIRGIESGTKRPGRALLRKLGEVYDNPPPGMEPAEPALDLIAALRAQTDAITDLVEELRADRRGREAVWEMAARFQEGAAIEAANEPQSPEAVAPGADR